MRRLFTLSLLTLSLLVACGDADPEPAAPAAEPAAAPADAAPAEEAWACPMHPEVTGSEGEDCSKCGMPLEAASAKTDGTHDHAMGH